MNKQEFLKSNYFKILLPLIIMWGVIVIVKGGYAFGQRLYAFLYYFTDLHSFRPQSQLVNVQFNIR